MIKVLLLEDEPKIARGWERMFRQRTDMVLVGALESADGLHDAVRTHAPDIVVFDLTMPGKDPIEAVSELSESHPDIRTVIYSGRADTGLIRRVFDAGAWAFVDKLRPPGHLFDTLLRVSAGEVILPDD